MLAARGQSNLYYVYATCFKDADPCSKALTCTLESYLFMSIAEPRYLPTWSYFSRPVTKLAEHEMGPED